jgi:hypothetical protein
MLIYLLCFVVKMAVREFVFEVQFGGHVDSRLMNSYVGGDVDVFKEVIADDKMSYSMVENIAKTYGYKSGDLMYYLLPGSTIRNGLILITSNHDVIEMVKLYQGLPIVELYIVSFDEPVPDSEYEYNDDDGDDGDDGGYSRIERDDPYWDEIYEPDLFVEDNDIPETSMGGGIGVGQHVSGGA